jgi:hypothetical protein
MTEGKKRRGRPLVGPGKVEIERELTREDLEWLRAWRQQRRGGRPKKNAALDKRLLKAADKARGIPLRNFIRSWVKHEFGHMPDIKEIRSWERRIYRLREKAEADKPAPLRQNPFVN